jgi:hypothetical protein
LTINVFNLKPKAAISGGGNGQWSFGFIGPSVYMECWKDDWNNKLEGKKIIDSLVKIQRTIIKNWNETVAPVLLKLYPIVQISQSFEFEANAFEWKQLSSSALTLIKKTNKQATKEVEQL